MFSLTLKSVRANKARFLLTSVAVILGVAFMAGTLVLTDTIKKTYDDVATNVYKDTDTVVRSSSHFQGNNDKTDVRGTIDAKLLDQVRGVKGVKAAEAQQVGVAVVVGKDGKLLDSNPERGVPIALGWQNTPELNPMELVSGHAPRAPDDVVVDQRSFDKGQFRVGETVSVVSQSGAHPYHLVGVVTYGGSDSAAGAQVVAFSAEAAPSIIGTPGRYTAIQVVAAPGVSQSQLVANIRAAVHLPGVEAITGAKATEEARQATGTALQFINIFLMTFAIVALVVGSFVIYNTFSITVAQRTKETALLRAIGAKRKQVTRSVKIEALLIGVFGSAAGVAAGVGIAQGLRLVLEAFGMDLPNSATVVNSSAIVVSMIVGVVVTFLAAWLPARKAAKVAPIEALRDVAVEPRTSSKRRVVFGALATVGGAYFIVQGFSGAGAGPVGLGAFAVFAGVAALGPVMARRFSRIVGAPLPKLRGMAGTLARENAARNPRRTSATASALMIGVGLVTLITVFAASARTSIAGSVDTAMKSEYIVSTQFGMGGLSPVVAQQLDALPETQAVTPVRFLTAKVGGSGKDISAFDAKSVDDTLKLNEKSGTAHVVGLHDVAVQKDEAEKKHLTVGDTITMHFVETGKQRMHVVGVYGAKDPFGQYVISMAAAEANFSQRYDNILLVKDAPGVSMKDARQAMDRVLANYPTAKLMTEKEFIGSVADMINKMLNLVYVLLAMALVIAFFGIANTLALSVYERTREFGLLRAVGMSRAQVRSTVRWESVLIAMLGTTLGTAIGVGFAWALVKASEKQGIRQLDIPVSQLAAIALFAALAAVIAATLPARRAAKLDVLKAISE
jgi:putative ABC transport system permease protein